MWPPRIRELWLPIPGSIPCCCGRGSCANKAQVLLGGIATNGEPPALLLAIFRIVYRSVLPRDHSVVYRKRGSCTLQTPGEVPCPSRFSWGGRRALNALVGGVGTPAHATSRAHKLWARLLRGHAQLLAGGFAFDGEPPSMLLTIFRIVYRSSLPHDLLIVYRKG